MNDVNITDPPVRHQRHKILPITLAAISGLMIATVIGAAAFWLITSNRFGGSTGQNPMNPNAGIDTSAPDDQSSAQQKLPHPDSEVRGVYIATVMNINYPSKTGLSVDEQRAELDDIVRTTKAANLNAIYFQVRPSSDALYKSSIFPTSEYITGKQGDDLEFDPLGYLVQLAHENDIKVHAWVNPLRITTGSATNPKTDPNSLAENNPARLHPEYTVAYADGRLYYNPGLHEVRQLIADGVREIVENYAVDGVIFDDYFYPYPTTVTVNGKSVTAEFDDSEAYSKYGGGSSLDDWRRANVNAMIEACYDAVKSVRGDCEFGVAPFGIWQNDDGKNGGSATTGFESYKSIYCDPVAWVEGGYVDYLAPQIYWRFSTKAARYDVLVRWWNSLLDGTDVDLLISHGVYNYSTWDNPSGELRNQIGFARSEVAYKGSLLYGYAALKENTEGLLDETKAVFSEDIIYTGTESNGRDLIISIPYNNSYIDGEGTFLIGTSDPAEPLYLDGRKIGRTKSGYFSVYLPLSNGKNTFTFSHKGMDTLYTINRGTPPTSTVIKYATLDSYKIAAVTPSMSWFGTTTSLSVSVTAPSGSKVTAEIGGKTFTLSPTIYPPAESTYMKEVYTGTVTLTAPASGIESIGRIKFKATRGSESATAESAELRIGAPGASIPVEILTKDTEMKIQTNSWYYDDYSPQSPGMTDNAVSLSSGWYKLRCGGYIAAENIKEIGGDPIGWASVTNAKIESGASATYIKFDSDVNVPINCYVENGEFVLTLYNMDTKNAPKLEYVKNPIFASIRQENSARPYAYKYFLKLYDIENFYGFDYYYEDGKIIVELKNPTTLPDSDRPLEGKTIVLDAGHGGRNPGALGPLGAAEGAMNESDFNLEIVMATVPKLEALGANVVLTRSRETEIDVPVPDRVQQLIDLSPDLCISIHQNSMPYTADVTKIHGLVGLYWSDAGYMLTDVMGKTMSSALNRQNRSPTQQRLAMVRNPKFPSTLIEVCFITNVEEYEKMMQHDSINRISDSIADGILNYYAAQAKYLN